jgi:hypothetical protein
MVHLQHTAPQNSGNSDICRLIESRGEHGTREQTVKNISLVYFLFIREELNLNSGEI